MHIPIIRKWRNRNVVIKLLGAGEIHVLHRVFSIARMRVWEAEWTNDKKYNCVEWQEVDKFLYYLDIRFAKGHEYLKHMRFEMATSWLVDGCPEFDLHTAYKMYLSNPDKWENTFFG